MNDQFTNSRLILAVGGLMLAVPPHNVRSCARVEVSAVDPGHPRVNQGESPRRKSAAASGVQSGKLTSNERRTSKRRGTSIRNREQRAMAKDNRHLKSNREVLTASRTVSARALPWTRVSNFGEYEKGKKRDRRMPVAAFLAGAEEEGPPGSRPSGFEGSADNRSMAASRECTLRDRGSDLWKVCRQNAASCSCLC